MINIKQYEIGGVFSFENRLFNDNRGHFYESFNQAAFEEIVGESVNFVQDNISQSKKNVLRGLHFQKPPHAQAKLVKVLQGSALDVVVDLRKNSESYGKSLSIILSASNHVNFFVPKGFAHGFVALEEDTVFAYKCDNYYHAESEEAIVWNDLTLNIDWGVKNPIVSEKDAIAGAFKTFNSPF